MRSVSIKTKTGYFRLKIHATIPLYPMNGRKKLKSGMKFFVLIFVLRFIKETKTAKWL